MRKITQLSKTHLTGQRQNTRAILETYGPCPFGSHGPAIHARNHIATHRRPRNPLTCLEEIIKSVAIGVGEGRRVEINFALCNYFSGIGVADAEVAIVARVAR